MQWVKAHLNVVIAGSVALLALVAVVLGFILPDPAAAMSKDQGLLSSLPSANGAPLPAIQDLTKTQLTNLQKLKNDQAKFVQGRELVPLDSGKSLFPKLDPRDQTAPFRFKREFNQKRLDLLKMLNAEDEPSATEISEVTERMQLALNQQIFEEGKNEPKKGPVPPSPTPGPQPGPTPFRMQAGPSGFPQLPADATPEQRMQGDPNTRAAVNKARRIYCYASVDSLDPRPAVGQDVTKPAIEDMWYAQVSLWIQEDILGALAGLNKAAAAELPAGESPWVGNLPFKHLKSILIGGYVPAPAATPSAMAGMAMSGELGGPPPMDAALVMSKHGTTDSVDRLQLTIDMVVEARSLPKVINAISSAGFYTVLQISYEQVPPNPTLTGYIYGPAPALRVWMVVECSLIRNKYEKLMPDKVKEEIKSGKPVGGGGASSSQQNSPMMRPPGFPGGPMGGPEGMRRFDPRFGPRGGADAR